MVKAVLVIQDALPRSFEQWPDLRQELRKGICLRALREETGHQRPPWLAARRRAEPQHIASRKRFSTLLDAEAALIAGGPALNNMADVERMASSEL
jgi:hypothetical protein